MSDVSFELEVGRFKAWTRHSLRDIEKHLQPKVIRAITKTVIEMLQELTPVDTGNAMRGWVGFAVINGKRETIRGRAARLLRDTEGARGTFKATTDRRFTAYSVIQNNVPYIMALEYGHSQQAPNGMIRITFARVRAGMVFSRTLAKELRASIRRTNARGG